MFCLLFLQGVDVKVYRAVGVISVYMERVSTISVPLYFLVTSIMLCKTSYSSLFEMSG